MNENINTHFEGFPKIPRLNREILITEKIDGTNAQVWICKEFDAPDTAFRDTHCVAQLEGHHVYVGSRNRFITPGDDNFGFAGWVLQNVEALVDILGEGRHFGEWWGKGIQRGYGRRDKQFSLFNTRRWGWLAHPAARADRVVPEGLNVVPLIYAGQWLTHEGLVAADEVLYQLSVEGSFAQPGYMDPEGIIVFHSAANVLFKATIDDDEKPKGAK
jgi:hypothetical protein